MNRSPQERMIDEQIRARGIDDPALLAAMAETPRHLFVPESYRQYAYEDNALPLEHRQTISQPYIVALMTSLLQVTPTSRVLEIGTGSGYQAAILARLAQTVFTVEIIPELSQQARFTLDLLGFTNIRFRVGDGYLGWPEHAPYDRILITAAPPDLPVGLLDQLAAGGRMVLPVGTEDQVIQVLTKTDNGHLIERSLAVRFVPMVHGQEGEG